MIITETIKKSTLTTAITAAGAKGLRLMGTSAAVTLGVIGGIALAGVAFEQGGKLLNRRKAKAEGKTVEQADKEYAAATAASNAATAGTFKSAVKKAAEVVKGSEKVVVKSAEAADAALDKLGDTIKDITAGTTPAEDTLKAVQKAADKAAADLAEFAEKPAEEVVKNNAPADSAAAPASEVFDAAAQAKVIEDVLNKSMADDKAAKAAKDAKDAEELAARDAAANAVHNADLAAEAQEHAPVTEVPKPAADVSAPSAIADAVKDIGKGDAK